MYDYHEGKLRIADFFLYCSLCVCKISGTQEVACQSGTTSALPKSSDARHLGAASHVCVQTDVQVCLWVSAKQSFLSVRGLWHAILRKRKCTVYCWNQSRRVQSWITRGSDSSQGGVVTGLKFQSFKQAAVLLTQWHCPKLQRQTSIIFFGLLTDNKKRVSKANVISSAVRSYVYSII